MLLRCQHDSSTVPLQFTTAELRFTTVELRMLTMRPRFDTVLVRFKPVVPRRPTRVVFLMNRGGSELNRGVSNTPIHPECQRMATITQVYGAATNEPDAATVELRFRPRPQSTTIHPECFKRFKIVVALSANRQDSSRITTVLLRFTPMSLRCYYHSCRCIPI